MTEVNAATPAGPPAAGPAGISNSRRRLLPRALVVAAVAGTLALGSVGVAYAAHASKTRNSAALPGSGTEDGQLPEGLHPHRLGPALHGEFVVAKEGGGYQTIFVQRGEVTEVSSSSITVKSADGFTRTYKVTGDTKVRVADGTDITKLKAGDKVFVAATGEDSDRTAAHVADGTARRPRK